MTDKTHPDNLKLQVLMKIKPLFTNTYLTVNRRKDVNCNLMIQYFSICFLGQYIYMFHLDSTRGGSTVTNQGEATAPLTSQRADFQNGLSENTVEDLKDGLFSFLYK